ncbi:alkaline phosphatase D family protein [Chenggangzhangella methanolivorans]|uniref:Alkaline phosphatase D family protein n=1 Tax=Chenggangzhangella methanolivorans TaxID=1437009 RepID=A0A9E6UQC0_9HYPH|nr:alkaline phosphatase D family protein [Chenggangzhangella methanolivorans]QZO00755.1 alkaline phosphatase D family protein [Chenggangzhangella methanolivorans]
MTRDDDHGHGPAGPALSRRDALRLTLAAGVSATSITMLVTDPAEAAKSGPFLHGVASGDPKAGRVVIWTRVTKADASSPIPVKWTLSSDAAMRRTVKEGTTEANAERDFTVKVDVKGLEPGETYYYRFEADGAASPVGRTKTLPVGKVKQLRLAAVSCSNFELGFFNAYREIARYDDLDAVLHLGDYIYEYGPGLEGYTTPAAALGLVPKPRDKKLEPREEIIALEQYRARHALYKTDRDLQKLHARNAVINIWDDHEVANDAWKGGAENHDPETEGDYQARKAAGIRAFYEWLPIREPADGDPLDPDTGNPDDLYRVFDFGDLARLVMIDTRQAGRDQQLAAPALIDVYSGVAPQGPFPKDVRGGGKPRQLLGGRQANWVDRRITEADQTWQLIGNQVLMFYQASPDIGASSLLSLPQRLALLADLDRVGGAGFGDQIAALGAAGLPFPLAADAWTGYPTARLAMLETLAKAPNPVVLTGDSHNAWTANLVQPSAEGPKPVAPEFGGTSVSSPGYEQYLLNTAPEVIAALFVESSAKRPTIDQLIYAEQRRRGFMLIEARPKAVTVDHVFVSTVFDRTYVTETVRFRVKAGERAARPVD